MSPKIPLTNPIESSMNVPGFKIDVGNANSQNLRIWTIANTSVTPIPPNLTNTQMNVSEGTGSTPKISSKANPQSKFPGDFLFNPSWNQVASQEPLRQSKQPTLNIPSGNWVHVGHEKWVDDGQGKGQLENVTRSGSSEGNPELMLHQNMEPKEKVTRHDHPYASKPRTAHASSLREETVDDEDENMSPNHSETNDEPRRDNFMAREEGTQSNSEFNHPQMPITLSV
ncbi:hypothetical protein O181_012943 [Austropuccinia psidii MF-1]|uniref:Uncharacterized protein n=1 Tax=Austropuccinia psidii MF-1 TaxID=1389203 RepID=A0A9Q3GMN3_9BASI|nr:hypothetical protein [Austropuccinia psidii MF-1]